MHKLVLCSFVHYKEKPPSLLFSKYLFWVVVSKGALQIFVLVKTTGM